jgi:hypothetical protein
MTKTARFLYVALISVAAASCSENSAEPPVPTATAAAAEQTTGTTGRGPDIDDGNAAENAVASGEDLPRTASPLPLVGAAGLIALAAAAGVRRLRSN